MMTPLLELKNISKSYALVKVLNNINFSVASGEIRALVGENGAGKSTTGKIIAGVEQPDNGGEIYFNGELIHKMTVKRSLALGIAVIYQDLSLFPTLSVAENIVKGSEKKLFVGVNTYKNQATEVLESLGVDSIDPSLLLSELSVGKQQLVAIARAMHMDARLIIMDEPTSTLSSTEVELLFGVIDRLKKSGVSIIYISHKLDEIFRIADSITVLRDGQHIETGTIDSFDQKKLIRLMVGRELRFIPFHGTDIGGAGNTFTVRNFTLEPHFRDVSFDVREREVFGITGLVGAGRSELAQAIFGIRKPTAGEMYLAGEKISISHANEAIAAGVCYLPEDRRTQGLFMGQTVIRNTTSSNLKGVAGKATLISEQKEKRVIDKYIKRLSIRLPSIESFVERLSGGNQQKVLISRWLYAGPKVLIVDEPTTGVDVGTKQEIHRLLRELANNGVFIVLISSDLPEVLAVSDRVMVMRNGNAVDLVETKLASQESILEKSLLG